MLHFTPTLGIRETSRNIRNFIAENKKVFWDILNPLLPWIIGLMLVDCILAITFYAHEPRAKFGIGALFANYFYAALIISWHRVVIHGPDNYKPVNPLKPTRNELIFMGMAMLIFLASAACGAFFIGLSALAAGRAGIVIGIVLAVLAAAWLAYKISFFFPARAADTPITVKQSFALTHGYFWRMTLATLLASLKLLLMLLGYCAILVIVAIPVIVLIRASGIIAIFHVLRFAAQLPAQLYFRPMFIVIGVSALSNYYLYAIQNKTT